MKLLLAGLLLSIAGVAAALTPHSASLVWTPPTLNTDGSAIAGAITYNLYQGPCAGPLVQVQSGLTVAAATVSTGLTPGQNTGFAVTAVVAGLESAQTAAACATIPFPQPNAPTLLTVTLH
jgi:hypothetical protein